MSDSPVAFVTPANWLNGVVNRPLQHRPKTGLVPTNARLLLAPAQSPRALTLAGIGIG